MNAQNMPRAWQEAWRTCDGFAAAEGPRLSEGMTSGAGEGNSGGITGGITENTTTCITASAPRQAPHPLPATHRAPPAPAPEPTALALAASLPRRDGVPPAAPRAPRPAGSQRVRRASVPVDGVLAPPPERGSEVVSDRGATPEQRRAMWGQSIDTVTIEDQTPAPKHRRVAAPGSPRATAELAAIAASEPLPTDFSHGVQ
jgi:hypothetical protein